MKNILLNSIFCATLLSITLSAIAQDEKEPPAEQLETKSADTPKKRAMPNSHANTQREISTLLTGTSTQVVKLTALEQEFEMYFLTAIEKEPLGSVLFFPDERNHSDWPVTLNPLRTGLTEHNWQTAVLTLPVTTLSKIPERSVYVASSKSVSKENEGAQETNQAAPEETTAAQDAKKVDISETESADTEQAALKQTMAETTMARAIATHSFLKNTTQGIVIVGIGQGATWATAFASTLTKRDKKMSRLILINPQQSFDVSAPALNMLIQSLHIDTFDIYTPTSKNSSTEQNSALKRKRAANLSEIEIYQQIKAPARAWGIRGNDWLYRKVRGVIKSNIMQDFKLQATKRARPAPPEKTNLKPGSTS